MMANTHEEPLRSVLARVDWWAVVSVLVIGVSAVLSGWLLTAVGHFIWRHWLA